LILRILLERADAGIHGHTLTQGRHYATP
jgi:hypothetical protein